jgi:hypothetical protein
MNQEILKALTPSFVALVVSFALLWLTARVCGAKLKWRALARLHCCQEGSVHSLSFVLTLPVFVMIVLFIVQISQLMIGVAVVHYAAFAAARAAVVWIPADLPGEPENTLDLASIEEQAIYPQWISKQLVFGEMPDDRVWKYRKIWSAAGIACVPIAPSRRVMTAERLADPGGAASSQLAETLRMAYQTLASPAALAPASAARLRNKFAYAADHTWIVMSGVDRSGEEHPTYNPYPGHFEHEPGPTGYMEQIWVPWKPNEISWEDPVTVWVFFRFPLLPGPGRFLATKLVQTGPHSTPDRVSEKVQLWKKGDHPGYEESIYWVELSANATLSLEGLKSVMPYAAPFEPVD